MAKHTIEVKNMSCAHCVSRISNALEPLAEILEVDLEGKLVWVESENELERLLNALNSEGYPGTVRKLSD